MQRVILYEHDFFFFDKVSNRPKTYKNTLFIISDMYGSYIYTRPYINK